MNFGNEITEILFGQSYYPSEYEVPKVLVLGGVPKGKPIVAKLLKLQEREERENMNCSNQVAENGRKKNCGNDISEMEGKKICGN